jgi:hypothetical protein
MRRFAKPYIVAITVVRRFESYLFRQVLFLKSEGNQT